MLPAVVGCSMAGGPWAPCGASSWGVVGAWDSPEFGAFGGSGASGIESAAAGAAGAAGAGAGASAASASASIFACADSRRLQVNQPAVTAGSAAGTAVASLVAGAPLPCIVSIASGARGPVLVNFASTAVIAESSADALDASSSAPLVAFCPCTMAVSGRGGVSPPLVAVCLAPANVSVDDFRESADCLTDKLSLAASSSPCFRVS